MRALPLLAVILALACAPMPASGVGSDVDTTPLGERDSTEAAMFRNAAALVKEKRYDEAIVALTPLRRTGSADVENLLGFSHRKMKRMPEARFHYELALLADPAHVPTLEYFGEWYVEMGMLEHAKMHLGKLAGLCGTECEAYKDLRHAIETGVPKEH